MRRAYHNDDDMTGLAGKTILLLGGAKGIGGALCETFLADGATVHVLDSDRAALNRVGSAGPHAVAR